MKLVLAGFFIFMTVVAVAAEHPVLIMACAFASGVFIGQSTRDK